MISPNRNEVQRWFRDNGDNTHILNHDLNDKSVVIDLGAYTGVWGKIIIDKFNCNLYLLEPIDEFVQVLKNKFKNYGDKVNIFNGAISNNNEDKEFFINGDATSSNIKVGEKIVHQGRTFNDILNTFNIVSKVDLLQMNIEGDEYSILEEMIESGSINKVKILQVQFHNGIENDIERRNNIQNKLIEIGYIKKYDYPFVWEAWEKLK